MAVSFQSIIELFFDQNVDNRGIVDISGLLAAGASMNAINDAASKKGYTQISSNEYQQTFASQVSASYITGTASYYPFAYISPIGTLTKTSQSKKPTKPKKKISKKSTISLSTVVMSDDKREEIRAAISQVSHNDTIFTTWGFSKVFEKGTAITLLLWGIPGTGKTLTAQAIADELGKKLKIYGTAEIESSEPGGAERTMKSIFSEAKKNDTVIVFDECDSLLVDRNEVGPILGAQINCLLGEIEKFNGVIIFTTNRLGKLDPALERRISAKIEFVFPDEKARKKIWLRLIPKEAPIDADVDFAKLAEHPLCGGNIKNVVLNAARMAAYQTSKTIKFDHFKKAIEREMASIQAFVSEYENASHSSVGGSIARTSSSIVLNKDIIKKRKLEKITSVFGKKP